MEILYEYRPSTEERSVHIAHVACHMVHMREILCNWRTSTPVTLALWHTSHTHPTRGNCWSSCCPTLTLHSSQRLALRIPDHEITASTTIISILRSLFKRIVSIVLSKETYRSVEVRVWGDMVGGKMLHARRHAGLANFGEVLNSSKTIPVRSGGQKMKGEPTVPVIVMLPDIVPFSQASICKPTVLCCVLMPEVIHVINLMTGCSWSWSEQDCLALSCCCTLVE